MPEIKRSDIVNFWLATKNEKILQTLFAKYLRGFPDAKNALKEKLIPFLKKNEEQPENPVIADLNNKDPNKEGQLLREFLKYEDDLDQLISETKNEALQLHSAATRQLAPPMKAGLELRPEQNIVLQRHAQGAYEANIADFFTLIKNSVDDLDANTADFSIINQHLAAIPNIDLTLRNLGLSIFFALKTGKLSLDTIDQNFSSTLDQAIVVRALIECATEHFQNDLNNRDKTLNNLINYFSILDKLNKTQLPKSYLIEVLENLQTQFGSIAIFIGDNFQSKALELYLNLLEAQLDSEASALRIEKLLAHKDTQGRNLDAYLEQANNLEISRKLIQLREMLEDKLPPELGDFPGAAEALSKLEINPFKEKSNEDHLSEAELAEIEAFKQKNPSHGARAVGLFSSEVTSLVQSVAGSKLASGITTPHENPEDPFPKNKPKQ